MLDTADIVREAMLHQLSTNYAVKLGLSTPINGVAAMKTFVTVMAASKFGRSLICVLPRPVWAAESAIILKKHIAFPRHSNCALTFCVEEC